MEIYQNLSLEDLPNEIWRDVVGYEGLYQVSNLGRIKSSSKILTQNNGHSGYLTKTLFKKGKYKTFYVHKIVANSWIGESGWKINGLEINHIDGNKRNNNINNLELVTRRENMKHGYRVGLINNNRKVYQYSSNGVYEREFDSLKEAASYHNSNKISHIADICSLKGNRKFFHGHTFRYFKTDKIDIPKRVFKKVLSFKDGILIKEYSSAKEAAYLLGVKENSIVTSCLRGYKCKGYNLKYK